jgi:CelD/BcsL family acetyltransferase involved in cellulose biosynthesis
MPIEFIRDVAAWDRIAPEWNDLLSRSAAGYPFLRCEFLRAWWNHLGGGEWPSAELQIALWREAGTLQGIAPLFRTGRGGESRWLLIGSVEISDYLDVLASPDHLPGFCSALLDALAALPESDFAALDLFNLPHHPGDGGGNRPPRMGFGPRAAPGLPGDPPAAFVGRIPRRAGQEIAP